MTYTYIPKGVCSRKMTVELNDDHTIQAVRVEGGCNGNLQGISRLVVGMDAQEAIRRMRGIQCGFKPTSCPDQLATALEQALQQGSAPCPSFLSCTITCRRIRQGCLTWLRGWRAAAAS